MRWFRPFLVPLVLLAAVLLVAACSDDDGDTTPTSTPATATEAASLTSTAETSATAEATSTESATSTATAEATSTSTSEATSTSTSTASATSTSTSEAGDNDYETEIENFAFEQGITVAAGITVRWENRDSVPHTVTADDGSFDSGLLATNETFELQFTTAGTFAFHCTVHPSMTATVTVQ